MKNSITKKGRCGRLTFSKLLNKNPNLRGEISKPSLSRLYLNKKIG